LTSQDIDATIIYHQQTQRYAENFKSIDRSKMKRELDELLCERYPKIFRDRHAPMAETAMCWGFECGDGWFNIIDQLCSNIQHHIDWKQEQKEKYERGEGCSQVIAMQVKEKFGTLRFYTSGGDDTIYGMIRMAESMSAVTCETCGSPGQIRGRGWMYTACDAHAKDEDLIDEDQRQQEMKQSGLEE